MPYIAESYLNELKETSVANYLAAAGIKVFGREEQRVISCISPNHDDKNPSMSVNVATGKFHCHSCGAGGQGVLSMHAVRMGMDYKDKFQEIVTEVSSLLGKDVIYDSPDDPLYKQKMALMEALHESMRDFLSLPADPAEAKIFTDYVESRGLTREDQTKFKFGYVPQKWVNSPVAVKYRNTLLDTGLIKESPDNPGRYYCMLAGRLVFPICNTKGNIIALAGRDITGTAKSKYINTNNSPIFNKSKALYGLKEALERNPNPEYIAVVEGYMDVIASQSANVITVATMGTAITAEHIKLLRNHTQNVVFVYDPDAAGEKALARAAIAALPYVEEMRFNFVTMPSNANTKYDPDKFIREFGVDAYQDLINQQEPITRAAAKYILGNGDFKSVLDLIESGMPERADQIYSAMPRGVTRALLSMEISSVVSGKIGLPLTPQQIGLGIDSEVYIKEMESEIQQLRAQAIAATELNAGPGRTRHESPYAQEKKSPQEEYASEKKDDTPQENVTTEGEMHSNVLPAAPVFFRSYPPKVGDWVVTESGEIGSVVEIKDSIARMNNVKNNPMPGLDLSELITLAPEGVISSKYSNSHVGKGDKLLKFAGAWHYKLSHDFYEQAASIITDPKRLADRDFIENIAIHLEGFRAPPETLPSIIAGIRSRPLQSLLSDIGFDKLTSPLVSSEAAAKPVPARPVGALINAQAAAGDFITSEPQQGEICRVTDFINGGYLASRDDGVMVCIHAKEAIKIVPDKVIKSTMDTAQCKKGDLIYKFGDTPWIKSIPLKWIEEFKKEIDKNNAYSPSP